MKNLLSHTIETPPSVKVQTVMPVTNFLHRNIARIKTPIIKGIFTGFRFTVKPSISTVIINEKISNAIFVCETNLILYGFNTTPLLKSTNVVVDQGYEK